jgi:hypothetical protein
MDSMKKNLAWPEKISGRNRVRLQEMFQTGQT